MAVTASVCPQCGVSFAVLQADVLESGHLLRATYRVEHAIGHGPYGLTYLAVHASGGHSVVVKEFFPRDHALRRFESADVVPTPDQRDVFVRGRDRFLRQGRLLVGLRNQNVVAVQDVFEEHGTAYLVMERVEGTSLRHLLDTCGEHGLEEARVAHLTRQLVHALDAIHERGLHHLDVCPENVMVTDTDRVVLIDFGEARHEFSRLSTQACTSRYAPMEMLLGESPGPETDIFELGMVVYELLTRTPPPRALERLLHARDWTPSGVPSPWDVLLAQALEMNRHVRPQRAFWWWESRTDVTEARPASPLSEDVTVVEVRADGRGEYRSLPHALEYAEDGAVLQLGAGLHAISQRLAVNRSVVISGGSAERCTVEFFCDGPGLVLDGPGTWVIADVTFRRTTAALGHAVEVRGGTVRFERCRFEGASGRRDGALSCGLRLLGRTRAVLDGCEVTGNAIGVLAGDCAQVSLDVCRFTNNSEAGLRVEGYVQGVVRGNTFGGTARAGILVADQARPIIEANHCGGHELAGILYVGHAGGRAWYNDCVDNRGDGMRVEDWATPQLDANRGSHNGGSGIVCAGRAGGRTRANECSDNGDCGIRAVERASPLLEENLCERNAHHGIGFEDQTDGECRMNTTLSNRIAGLFMKGEARVTYAENVSRDNGENGIGVEGAAHGVIRGNRVTENNGNGIAVSDEASPLIEGNEVARNAMAGVLVHGKGRPRLVRNRLTRNLYGVYVGQEASPRAEGNTCNDNRASGIALFGRSGGYFWENEMVGNVHGIYVDDHATPTVEGNRLTGNSDSGGAWFGSSGGEANHNEVKANEGYGLCVCDGATPRLIGNRSTHNRNCGLHYEGEAGGLARRNELVGNARHGIQVVAKAQPALEENKCTDNRGAGMSWGGSARGYVHGNLCARNEDSGVRVSDEARPTLQENRLVENGGCGLAYLSQAGGTARANVMTTNEGHGIGVRDRAHPRLHDNVCEANRGSGLAWQGRSTGHARGNRCRFNDVFGISVTEDATPHLVENPCSFNLEGDQLSGTAEEVAAASGGGWEAVEVPAETHWRLPDEDDWGLDESMLAPETGRVRDRQPSAGAGSTVVPASGKEQGLSEGDASPASPASDADGSEEARIRERG